MWSLEGLEYFKESIIILTSLDPKAMNAVSAISSPTNSLISFSATSKVTPSSFNISGVMLVIRFTILPIGP